MITKAHRILLERDSRVFIEAGDHQLEPQYLATLLKNLEPLGYTLSVSLIEKLQSHSIDEVLEFAKILVPILQKRVGAHVSFEPMYPNFPEQVMEMHEVELYLNAINHYWGDALGVRILPETKKKKKKALHTFETLQVVELAEEDEPKKLLKNLIAAKTSVSTSDTEYLHQLLACYRDAVDDLIDDEIEFREVKTEVCVALVHLGLATEERLVKQLTTATDILRFAVKLSGGDVSLARKSKFKNFPRSQRRLILSSLNAIKYPLEDMFRYRMMWIRLGEKIHPGDYATVYTTSYENFSRLRNNEAPKSFNAQVEKLFREQDFSAAVVRLKSRPGELARKLDFLIRSSDATDTVIAAFQETVDQLKTPLLLNLLSQFKKRKEAYELKHIEEADDDKKPHLFQQALRKIFDGKARSLGYKEDKRIVFPKGQLGKLMRIPAIDKELPKEVPDRISHIVKEELVRRFSALESLGKVYVDPVLKDYLVPFSQRSASKALKTVPRGSQIRLAEKDSTLRFFLWWKEGNVNGKPTGRVDVDLSATFYSDSWAYVGHISYTNLKSDVMGCYHSGDITSAPHGACEFIDIDIRKAKTAGARYLVTSLHAFTSQAYCDLPECFAGWMFRKKPQSGEVFEPSTVKQKVDIGANTRIAVPCVIDLEEMKLIWADLSLRSSPHVSNNIESADRGLVHYANAMVTMHKPNLYDLFHLHATARAKELVDNIDSADFVFSLDGDITPSNIAEIVSSYLV